MKRNRATNSAPLSELAIARIRELVESEGEPATLAMLHISRPTLGRACGRMPITYATRFMIETRVSEMGRGHVG